MQRKKGISLIVLVITIIVMIVLAGAIILSLNNSGVIGKANQAVKNTDEATLKELVQMAWAEAYASGIRHVEGNGGLREKVEQALTSNGLTINDYGVVVTTKGVTIKKGWLKNGFEVVKGKQKLEIGSDYNYDETNDGKEKVERDVDWKVLGADENGNLLIMSATDVKTGHRIGYDSSDITTESQMEECQNDWMNAVVDLDDICESYGKGKGAVGKARSITVEDVNAVLGYDPKTASNGKPYGSGELNQYGNEVTYSYNGTKDATSPIYSSTVKRGTLNNAHTSGFYYNDKHITDLATGERGKAFVTLTSNYYYYTAPKRTTDNAKVLDMIFGEYDEDNNKYLERYWLASPYVATFTSNAYFGMRGIYYGSVSGGDLFMSNGYTGYFARGVRAVVTISLD